MGDAIKILIIDENPIRVLVLEEGLREAGYSRIVIISDMRRLLHQVVEADPDVIFIDLENPNRDVLEQMFHVSRHVRRPIASASFTSRRVVSSSGPASPQARPNAS